MWAIITAIFKGLGDSVAAWMEKRRTEKMAVELNELEGELIERKKLEEERKRIDKIKEDVKNDLADPKYNPLSEL